MNEVPHRRFAAAHRQAAFIVVQTWSGYRNCALDPEGAQYMLAPDCSDADLGRALLDALARSRFFTVDQVRTNGFFDYDNRNRIYADWVKKLMGAYRFKTKRALFKQMDYVEITLPDDGMIAMTPKHHVKLEAWEEAPGVGDVTVAANGPPESIGAALRKAFTFCTGSL